MLAIVGLSASFGQEVSPGDVRGAWVTGSVTDPREEPVADALVTLEAAVGTRSTRTDSAGQWALPGVPAGRWTLRIEAEGLITVEGFVDVPESGRPEAVVVEMRSIEEATPRSWEGSPATIMRWLELGNALLQQGRPAAARLEYEKALAVLASS
jgi:hypothetical protein